MTAHKSKGLEFDNIAVLYPEIFDKIRSKAVTDWQKQQETNLLYVAYTRTKNGILEISSKPQSNVVIERQENTIDLGYAEIITDKPNNTNKQLMLN